MVQGSLFALIAFDGVEPSRTYLVVAAKDRFEAEDKIEEYMETDPVDFPLRDLEGLDIVPMYDLDAEGAVWRA